MSDPTWMQDTMSRVLKVKVENFLTYHDGFSFTVPTELDAYKCAYQYQGKIHNVVVRFAPNVNQWSVQVYKEPQK